MSARSCHRLCAALLFCSLPIGTVAIVGGAPAYPFFMLAVVASVGMQIADRLARGIPVFAVGAAAQPRR